MCEEAERIFTGTGVQLTEDGPGLEHKNGQRHLGAAAVGTSAFINEYVSDKVFKWSADIQGLALPSRRPSRMLRTRRTYSAHATARRLYRGACQSEPNCSSHFATSCAPPLCPRCWAEQLATCTGSSLFCLRGRAASR